MNNVPRRESNPARRANLPGAPGSTYKPRPDLNTPLASTYKAPDYKENKYITQKEQSALPIDWDKD
jgi:hypothetical protein